MNNIYFLLVRRFLTSILIMLSLNSFAQQFHLPATPSYDSLYVNEYNGTVQRKSYFSHGVKVFEIGYNTGSMFYTPFFDIGGGQEDSCYAYFNGKNHDQYDFYYISESYITNEKYAENSKLFRYNKFKRNNVPIEKGNYYFIKEMYQTTISHNSKYKIGKWITYNSNGKPVETINYDSCTINGKPIVYKGSMSIIESLKKITDKKILDVYGKEFVSTYIRFNLDRSGYYETTGQRPEQPGGYPLLKQNEDPIQYVDLSYDIIIGDDRFNVLHFRVTKDGKLLGRTHFPEYMIEYFHLTQGLDSLNHGSLHKNVLHWKKLATEKGFDITSRDFNAKFEWTSTGNYYGDLRFVIEQVTKTTSTPYSFSNTLKQYIINPWTGEIKESTNEEGIETIMSIDALQDVDQTK